jgi:hypothetical protein
LSFSSVYGFTFLANPYAQNRGEEDPSDPRVLMSGANRSSQA